MASSSSQPPSTAPTSANPVTVAATPRTSFLAFLCELFAVLPCYAIQECIVGIKEQGGVFADKMLRFEEDGGEDMGPSPLSLLTTERLSARLHAIVDHYDDCNHYAVKPWDWRVMPPVVDEMHNPRARQRMVQILGDIARHLEKQMVLNIRRESLGQEIGRALTGLLFLSPDDFQLTVVILCGFLCAVFSELPPDNTTLHIESFLECIHVRMQGAAWIEPQRLHGLHLRLSCSSGCVRLFDSPIPSEDGEDEWEDEDEAPEEDLSLKEEEEEEHKVKVEDENEDKVKVENEGE